MEPIGQFTTIVKVKLSLEFSIENCEFCCQQWDFHGILELHETKLCIVIPISLFPT